MTRSRRAIATVLTLATSALGLVALAGPAQAAAPVTVADSASMYPGNVVEVEPLANDTDADGDDLAICRIAESTYKRVDLVVAFDEEGQPSETLLLFAGVNAEPGTYTFTYYACDFETLVPGTLTLTIEEPPAITAKALPGKPGKIKVKNPADFKIRFLYGSFREAGPDGVLKIARNSSVVISVRRTRIDWIALSRKGEFLRRGKIEGIVLPPGTTPPAAGRTVSPRLAKLWASGV